MRTIPTCSPFGPTSRTSGTRMRSLMRVSVLIWDLLVSTSWRDGAETRSTRDERAAHRRTGTRTRGGAGGGLGALTCIAVTHVRTREGVVAFRRVAGTGGSSGRGRRRRAGPPREPGGQRDRPGVA